MVLMEKLDYNDFKDLFGDEWAPKFKPFIESKGMWDIYQKLKGERETIVPKSSDTFRAFSTISPANLKVVFYLMDPFPRKYRNGEFQATGIAMDCSNTPDGKLQPSLDIFYNAIDEELTCRVDRSPSLLYLQEQGVMMLNSDLTCKLNKTGSHLGLWVDFQRYFLQEVLYSHTGLIFVLCGDASFKMEKLINPLGNYIFKLNHPSSAQYGTGKWDSKGIFTKINRLLKENNDTKVFWNKADWDNYKEPPF